MPEMRAAGIIFGFGSDCVMDPWYSLGSADMLDVAAMGLHVGQVSSRADMRRCFDAVTVNSAAIMGLQGYVLEPGCAANMVLLQAADSIEAIRLRATRLAMICAGRLIARTPAQTASLSLPGCPASVDPASYAPTGPT